MAFNFFKWLLRARDAPEAVTMEEMFDLFTDCYVRELAFQSCVNLTANAVSKCDSLVLLAAQRREGVSPQINRRRVKQLSITGCTFIISLGRTRRMFFRSAASNPMPSRARFSSAYRKLSIASFRITKCRAEAGPADGVHDQADEPAPV